MMKSEWLRCPVCGNKTRNRIREDTILLNYPLFCPKCKQETLINIQQFDMSVIKESDAKTQSRKKQRARQRKRALTVLSLYCFLQLFIAPRGIWAPFGHHSPKKRTNTGDKRNAENAQKRSVYADSRRFLIPQPT